MRRQVYNALENITKNRYVDQSLQDIRQAVHKNNSEDLCLTLKDYQFDSGISHFIHMDLKDKKQLFQITGPMGKGLSLDPTGHNVAYSAGTGVLVFMDLVG